MPSTEQESSRVAGREEAPVSGGSKAINHTQLVVAFMYNVSQRRFLCININGWFSISNVFAI